MWSDNETTTDLFGFKVHADLIRHVVTDSTLLPVVLGVFGDWGGGKSSIMKMLEQDLNSEAYKNVVCLYFNGWMFEGYEDAKTALLSSILLQLGEHKRFGPKIKERIVGMLRRVKRMEITKLAVKHVGVPLAAGWLTGGVATIPALLASFIPSLTPKAPEPVNKDSQTKEDKEETNWLDLVDQDTGKIDLLEIRKFREDFEKMIADTEIESLVILIDDLDRCLPERIIETLEAIKLFVAVPKTAFVIGADPRIVRHAIATRYIEQRGKDTASNQELYDLVQDYLEKLIQIPYHLPRLSPAEIETYINLLACQKFLPEEGQKVVNKHWQAKRLTNFYGACKAQDIKETLTSLSPDSLPPSPKQQLLEQQLSWSSTISLVITEGLKGNPRQVKRMLNAMLLRKRLAEVAKITIKDEVLAKLMVLEYSHLQRFHELNSWQASENGYPKKLKKLENTVLEKDSTKSPDESLKDWQAPSLQNWLCMEPSLADVDLRDYFWLARDRTNSTLAGMNMVSPLVRRLFDQLISNNTGEQGTAVREASKLDDTYRESLLQLLQQQIERYPDKIIGAQSLYLLAEINLTGAAQTLFKALRNVDSAKLDPGIAHRLKALRIKYPDLRADINNLLTALIGDKKTRIGRAAEEALRD